MKCKICNTDTVKEFEADILGGKYRISYFHCPNCGFMQTEKPYWLKESYSTAMNLSDTGVVKRNLLFGRITSSLIYVFFNRKSKMLDFGGGHGMFTRIMRDKGFDFYWRDKYAENIFARGFEFPSNEKVEVVTAFEVFEHLEDPLGDIEEMLNSGRNVIFSTVLLPDKIPQPDDWWYYGFDHGQHIAFYSKQTLNYIAEKYHLKAYSRKDFHLLTPKKISLTAFKFIFLLSLLGLDKFVSMSMSSKTLSDNQMLKDRVLKNLSGNSVSNQN